MYLDIAGIWHIRLMAESGEQEGDIRLPGILQAQGYGNDISHDTPWVSGLHDSGWWKREEYSYAQENGVKAPFLAQPPKHFLGRAFYERDITVTEETEEDWNLYIEITHWKTTLYVDGEKKGSDCSLCTAHRIGCGKLSKGVHSLTIEIDNSMQYPYRPDGHGVSDALGATWNGMVGEMALFTESERQKREREKKAYAGRHPRHIEVRDGKFYVDGRPEYFRGTHFGGDYPLTGYPVVQKAWWTEKMRILKAWGLNFIRCHSYCPPEAAFAAADEEGIYIQPECGMWNYFEEGIPMLDILREETERILCQFGHHPSFVLFSPSNEPSGDWYKVLREWVERTRAYDAALGYVHRRVYTAQTGWFYDVAPEQVEGVDYLYFHRSAYGPYLGGNIRGEAGWHGGDYSPSLGRVDKPVICHELGQWCVYPDFDIINSFTGYLQPGNYEVFQENCRANGLLPLAKTFSYSSGRSQLRLYKEDIEANLRTPQLYGFELLDIRDYLGQGTALVGLLDAFWREKGYVGAEEFRQFCGETVLLAAFPSYVYTTEGRIRVPVSICHFGKRDFGESVISWELWACGGETARIAQGRIAVSKIPCGQNTFLGVVEPDMEQVREIVKKSGQRRMEFRLKMEGVTENVWKLYVYDRACADSGGPVGRQALYIQDSQQENSLCYSQRGGERALYTQDSQQGNSQCHSQRGGEEALYIQDSQQVDSLCYSQRGGEEVPYIQDSQQGNSQCHSPHGSVEALYTQDYQQMNSQCHSPRGSVETPYTQDSQQGNSQCHSQRGSMETPYTQDSQQGNSQCHSQRGSVEALYTQDSQQMNSQCHSQHGSVEALYTQDYQQMNSQCHSPHGSVEVLYTQDWWQAKAGLREGKTVVYAPFLSDLGYECPPLSIKNIFWNGQMGPSWGRNLGLVADTDCPLFLQFPTEAEGGWQWEDILARARGFCIQEGSLKGLRPVVRVIDDWNRNLPLALIWEAQVEQGKLLLASADLSGDFTERPAAYALRAALCKYAASPDFVPETVVQTEDIERNLFPVLRMEELTKTVVYEDEAAVTEGLAFVQANPDTVTCIRQRKFPVILTIELKRGMWIEGILYVPDQRERERTAFPKEAEILVWEEESGQWVRSCKTVFHNSSRSQEIRWEPACFTQRIQIVINSCYGDEEAYGWEEYKEGYRYVRRASEAVVRIAGIHVLCDEEAVHDNRIFWEKRQASATKEIEA